MRSIEHLGPSEPDDTQHNNMSLITQQYQLPIDTRRVTSRSNLSKYSYIAVVCARTHTRVSVQLMCVWTWNATPTREGTDNAQGLAWCDCAPLLSYVIDQTVTSAWHYRPNLCALTLPSFQLNEEEESTISSIEM